MKALSSVRTDLVPGRIHPLRTRSFFCLCEGGRETWSPGLKTVPAPGPALRISNPALRILLWLLADGGTDPCHTQGQEPPHPAGCHWWAQRTSSCRP